MKKKYADYLIKLSFLTLALFLVFNFSILSGYVAKVLTVIKPVLFGIVFYMVLAVPYDFFEKLFTKIKNKKIKKALSLFLTVLLFAGAATLLGVLTVPQSIESIREISDMLSQENALTELSRKSPFISTFAEWGQKSYRFFSQKLTDYVPKLFSYAKEIFTGVYNVFFGIFIGLLLLAGRDSVKRQFKNTVRLIFPENKCRILFGILKKTVSKFSKYLGGQVTEAFILGTACYLAMLVLKVPYPALIGLVIGFSNLIPVIGAYVGGAVCAVLVFAVDPVKCLVFIIAVFVLQQLESFTTYPVIVGKYVGLNGFWITVSVLVWGGLFGIWGLLLGVPITAVLQDILRGHSKGHKFNKSAQ